MSISVKEAMNIGGLKKARLIAGHNGVENLIEHVSVIEVPDAHEWFRGKELFLSAFYNIQNDLEKQLNLVETLKEKNVSALGVCYPGLYYDTLSPKVLAKANELSIPIIEIPREVAYIDIISPIIETIQKKQSTDLQQALLIQNQLHEWLAKSLGLPEIISRIGKILDEDIVIVNHHLDIIGYRTQNDGNSAGDSHIETSIRNNRSKFLFNGKPSPIQWSSDSGMFYSYPIRSGETFYGYLVIVRRNQNSSLKSFIYDYLSTSLALYFSQKASIEETNKNYQKTFIDELLAGGIVSPQNFIDRSAKLGWNFHSIIGLALIQTTKESPSLEQLSILIETFLHMEKNKSILFFYGGTLLLFLEDSAKSEEEFDRYYHGLFEKLSVYLNKNNIRNLTIVFSKQAVNFVKEARDIYKELLDILTIKLKMPVLPKILFAPSVPIFPFIHSNFYHPSIIRMRNLLDPLEKYDQQYQTDLVDTLEHLLFSKDIQQLPDQLNIHRNTLNYRRQRIKDILQVNPFDSPYRTQFELAILFKKIN